MFLSKNREKSSVGIIGNGVQLFPWHLKGRGKKVKSIEELSGQVAHHDREHAMYWQEIRTLAHRNNHLHSAVTMIVHMLQEMAREGKLDRERVQLIDRELIEAMGRPQA